MIEKVQQLEGCQGLTLWIKAANTGSHPTPFPSPLPIKTYFVNLQLISNIDRQYKVKY